MPRPTRTIDPRQLELADDITTITASMKRLDHTRQKALWNAHTAALDAAVAALKSLAPEPTK